MKNITLSIALLAIAQTTYAVPMYYTIEAEVTQVGPSSYYSGPVQVGDSVYYHWLIDTDINPAPPYETPDYPDTDYYYAELIWKDYGHGLGLQYSDYMGYGRSEDPTDGCSDTRGCSYIMAPLDGIIIGMPPTNGYLLDSTISNSGIMNGRIRDITITPADVPAPASLALLVFGLVGIGFSRRKKV